MTFEQFIESVEDRDLSLIVVNRDSPRSVQSMLESLFAEQPIAVEEKQIPDEDRDMVYLIDDEKIIAASPLASLKETILPLNSDLYITGAREVTEFDLPDVIEALEGVQFELRGYPESHNEKLLLITIARVIERLALESDGENTARRFSGSHG